MTEVEKPLESSDPNGYFTNRPTDRRINLNLNLSSPLEVMNESFEIPQQHLTFHAPKKCCCSGVMLAAGALQRLQRRGRSNMWFRVKTNWPFMLKRCLTEPEWILDRQIHVEASAGTSEEAPCPPEIQQEDLSK